MPSKPSDLSTALETSFSEIQIIKQTFGTVSAEEQKRQDTEYLMMHVKNVERDREERLAVKRAARKKRLQISSILEGPGSLKALNLTPGEIMQAQADDNIFSRPLFAVPQPGEVMNEPQTADQASDGFLDDEVWDCLTICGKMRHAFESTVSSIVARA